MKRIILLLTDLRRVFVFMKPAKKKRKKKGGDGEGVPVVEVGGGGGSLRRLARVGFWNIYFQQKGICWGRKAIAANTMNKLIGKDFNVTQ